MEKRKRKKLFNSIEKRKKLKEGEREREERRRKFRNYDAKNFTFKHNLSRLCQRESKSKSQRERGRYIFEIFTTTTITTKKN